MRSGQLLHCRIDGGDFLLVVDDAAVDVGPAFVDGLEAGAVERRGLHQTLQINPGVFDREILVLKQQLFFSVKQGAACLGFLNVPMQAVAQGLKPLAFLRRFRPAQGVGVVPVRNVQHREPTLAGQPDAGRGDAGVQPETQACGCLRSASRQRPVRLGRLARKPPRGRCGSSQGFRGRWRWGSPGQRRPVPGSRPLWRRPTSCVRGWRVSWLWGLGCETIVKSLEPRSMPKTFRAQLTVSSRAHD